MKKEIKEKIAKHKLTDDQIEKALDDLVKTLTPAPPTPPAENPPANVPTPAVPKKKDKVEPESTSQETPETPETPPGETGDGKKLISISKEDLDALLEKKVVDALAKQPKAQPKLHPTIENPNRPKQYKELKKTNG